jgi:hypothetical protein
MYSINSAALCSQMIDPLYLLDIHSAGLCYHLNDSLQVSHSSTSYRQSLLSGSLSIPLFGVYYSCVNPGFIPRLDLGKTQGCSISPYKRTELGGPCARALRQQPRVLFLDLLGLCRLCCPAYLGYTRRSFAQPTWATHVGPLPNLLGLHE